MWSIDKSGPREQVVDELYNSPIPAHLIEGAVATQQAYSRQLDATIAALRASSCATCSVNVTGEKGGGIALAEEDGHLKIVDELPAKAKRAP